jgi:hypothetical protein
LKNFRPSGQFSGFRQEHLKLLQAALLATPATCCRSIHLEEELDQRTPRRRRRRRLLELFKKESSRLVEEEF